MRTALVFIVFILNFSIVSIAQQKEVNNIDSKGKKQGKWIKRDENGFITYIGVFKDDLPKGAFKYYYPTNDTVLKSLVIHSADGKTTWVSNYHFNKKIMSQGKYTDKLRDSSWVFYHEAGFKIAEEN
ncbi:MAG: toxin-antitoxin system YwqK family antitoxin, partial [Bacteroidota bacterium]